MAAGLLTGPDRVHYFTLGPAQQYCQPIYVGHPWVVADQTGDLAVFLPAPASSAAFIRR